MAASDSRPVPRKNTAYRVYFPILDADGDKVTGAATLDSEVSIDGGAFADCTNEATEIGTSGSYYLDLTAAEMNGDGIVVQVKTGTAGAKTTDLYFYPEELGDFRVVTGMERSGTSQAVGATSLTMDAAAAYADNVLVGNIVKITSGTHAGTTGVITANVGATDVLTIGGGWMGGVTPTGTPTFEVYSTPAGSGVAQTGDVYSLLTSILPDSIPADGTRPTPIQAIYMGHQYLIERSVSGTTVTIKKVDGTTTLFTQQLNDATTPTSVTRLT